MKREFEMKLVVKGATKELAEGMGVGVLASQVVTLTIPKDYKDSKDFLLHHQLYQMGQEFIDSEITCEVKEIKDDEYY